MTESHELRGKGAIVVGGAGAIGRAIAAGLVNIGMNVVMVDVVDTIEKVAQELGRGALAEVVGLQADVSDEQEVDRVFAETRRVLGNPYALIHAAGVYPRKALLDLEAREWDATQAVNLRSFFLCTRSAVRMMSESGEGRIRDSQLPRGHEVPLMWHLRPALWRLCAPLRRSWVAKT
jgi:NAD(P)-dependent dehydrogenase (short-subunit alcohol dehydrogenase family)